MKFKRLSKMLGAAVVTLAIYTLFLQTFILIFNSLIQ